LGSDVHGLAAVHCCPPIVMLPGVIDISIGSEWLMVPEANDAGRS
jgi:hypothetical protein